MSRCCCLILNYNDSETTNKLINYIHDYQNVDEILVVDNCSTDNSVQNLKNIESDKVHIISCLHNGGYGAGNNYGVKYAHMELNCDYVIISNPDVLFSEHLIGKVIAAMEENLDCAAIAAIQYNIENKKINDVAWKIPSAFRYAFTFSRIGTKFARTMYEPEYYSDSIVCVDCVPGAMLTVDAKKFIEIQGYDERMFLYCEEDTLGYKIRKSGYKTLLLSDEQYIHEHSVSINKSISSIIEQQKMVCQSKLFFMEEYLHANPMELLLAQLNASIKLALLKSRITWDKYLVDKAYPRK